MKMIRLQNLFKTPLLPALLSLLATGQIAYSTTYTWNNPLRGQLEFVRQLEP